MGILVPGIQYTHGPAIPITAPTATIFRLTSPIMKGDQVLKIQKALQAAGFNPGTLDGEFGPHTSSAVQHENGLTPDGEVGPATAQVLTV